MKKSLRIAINAQIPSGSGTGGIETVLRVLASLGQLDGEEEYIFIGHCSDSDWLKPFMNERQKLIPAPSDKNRIVDLINYKLPSRLGKYFLRKGKHLFSLPPKAQLEIPASNGFYESLGCNVIHFPYQHYTLCRLPTIYNPHDLQHLHYPNFFLDEEIKRRAVIYPGACRAAQTVVVASQFVKQDVTQNYGIEADKIQVIPWSPPQMAQERKSAESWHLLGEKYKISDEPFILYPAMTWEHKNHIRLLEAIALLRESDNLKINLICTGDKNDFFPQIERQLQKLKLEDQVRFLGIIPYEELSALYRQAQFVIIPTLFEAASGPLFEAWQHDAAAACSAVTSLPEQASDAALLFNPFSVEAIAEAIKKMSLNESLRKDLRAKGAIRLSDFSLERTLKSYRAVYRKAAGQKLNDEDRDLLGLK